MRLGNPRNLLGAAALAACGLTWMNPAQAVLFQTGDVFAAVGNGDIDHYTPGGVFIETLNIGAGGFTTGMAFDGAGNLFATGFSAGTVAKFNNSGVLQGNFAAGFSSPESLVLDQAGHIFVGSLGNGINKYNPDGTFVGNVTGNQVDWFDLSADQSTFLYGQEGNRVLTVSNGLPGVAGPDFDQPAAGVINAFAMRILADGGLLLADRDDVKRLDAAGNLVQTYDDAAGCGGTTTNGWFALNLDPDGSSFWSGSFNSGCLFKFDIDTGNVLQVIDTGSFDFYGVAVFGEITAGGPPPSPSPEPSTVLLMLLGAAALFVARRRVAVRA